VPNLIWKREAKDPKKREDHLIFINFGIKNVLWLHNRLICIENWPSKTKSLVIGKALISIEQVPIETISI
jgi:hypothetical protein